VGQLKEREKRESRGRFACHVWSCNIPSRDTSAPSITREGDRNGAMLKKKKKAGNR
jgi:hypothetical protein